MYISPKYRDIGSETHLFNLETPTYYTFYNRTVWRYFGFITINSKLLKDFEYLDWGFVIKTLHVILFIILEILAVYWKCFVNISLQYMKEKSMTKISTILYLLIRIILSFLYAQYMKNIRNTETRITECSLM